MYVGLAFSKQSYMVWAWSAPEATIYRQRSATKHALSADYTQISSTVIEEDANHRLTSSTKGLVRQKGGQRACSMLSLREETEQYI